MTRSIFLGAFAAIAAGLLLANLYTSIVDAPNWGANVPDSILATRAYYSVANPGNFFRIFSPLNQALGLIAVFLCWRHNRYLAIAAFVTALVVEGFTFGYFYPRNEIMFVAPVDESAIRTAWEQWSSMNWLRTVLCLIETVLSFTLLILTVKKSS